MYATHSLAPPVLLANKANAATIVLSTDNPDNPAAQHAIKVSSAGAIKLLQLIGALLCHKDGEHRYQDKCRIFMREQKLELYNLNEPGTFPDVSNTRYGCYTYTVAEVVCFHGLIQELVTEIVLGKAKAGTYNHVEKKILKGLNCAATMTELVALALYGASVSWPYVATVHGTKDEPINLLSLTDLHRKLSVLCAHTANNPNILLDDQLTIDGRPFRNEFLLTAITQISGELPNLSLVISSMFSGTETGWIQFTPEFHIDGTFDRLPPEQRATVFILSTNDCSGGMLGTYRVHMRHHPNSTAHSFLTKHGLSVITPRPSSRNSATRQWKSMS
jgi:hypothetical protein